MMCGAGSRTSGLVVGNSEAHPHDERRQVEERRCAGRRSCARARRAPRACRARSTTPRPLSVSAGRDRAAPGARPGTTRAATGSVAVERAQRRRRGAQQRVELRRGCRPASASSAASASAVPPEVGDEVAQRRRARRASAAVTPARRRRRAAQTSCGSVPARGLRDDRDVAQHRREVRARPRAAPPRRRPSGRWRTRRACRGSARGSAASKTVSSWWNCTGVARLRQRDRAAVVELRRARAARRQLDVEAALEEHARPDPHAWRRVCSGSARVVDLERDGRRVRPGPGSIADDLADVDAGDPHRASRGAAGWSCARSRRPGSGCVNGSDGWNAK